MFLKKSFPYIILVRAKYVVFKGVYHDFIMQQYINKCIVIDVTWTRRTYLYGLGVN